MIYSLALLFARVTGQTAPVTKSGSEVLINCNSSTATSEVIFQAKASDTYTKNKVSIDTGAVLSDECVQIKTDIPSPDPAPGSFTSGTQKVVVFCDKTNDDLFDVNADADGLETRQNNLITDITTAVGDYGDRAASGGVAEGKNRTITDIDGSFSGLNTNANSLTNNLDACTAGQYMAWDATNDDWSCHPV